MKYLSISIVLVVLMFCSVPASAITWCHYDGDTAGVYSNSRSGCSGGFSNDYYLGSNTDLYARVYFKDTGTCLGGSGEGGYGAVYVLGGDDECYGSPTQYPLVTLDGGEHVDYHLWDGGINHSCMRISVYQYSYTITYIISDVPLIDRTVSGECACVLETTLYIKNSDGSYEYQNSTTDDTYSWDILEGIDYKIAFDTLEYAFTCDGDEVYDVDNCIYTHYRFLERCNNLISDTEGFYIEKIGVTAITADDFYTSNGIFTIDSSPATSIYFNTKTFAGNAGFNIDPVVNDTTYNLTNNVIAWSLKIVVVNESNGEIINDSTVKVNQSCYCTAGQTTRQKKTVNGVVDFSGMSLQDASLWVHAPGYKILDENTTGYHVTLSGRPNFDSKTWVVKLANSNTNNTSKFFEVANKVNIYFKDINNNITSQIKDTDANVYLYYENNNTAGDPMHLKFQSSSTHTHFIDELSWVIPNDDIGYKTIANSYFTPSDYSYRAVIYNSSVHGWNMTIPLTVRDATDDEHYANLSTSMWFRNTDAGKIDAREDMEVVVHACSDNESLLDIDVEIHKDGTLLCYKNLSASDFIGASYPYYYVYDPEFSYVSGSNYSVRMFGFDRTILETDYVDCITDNVIRQNKLTINVQNRAGTPLTNAFIFLEGWGSLPTDSLSYNAYEGIEDGTYQYKASKSGYTAPGWETIVIDDGDESVTYTLTAETSTSALTSEKMSDNDIKDIFFPIMFFLFIMILLGGLKYVAK